MFNVTLKPRLIAAGLVVAAAMVAPAGASAFSNGDPCPPYWTQDTAPTASFASTPGTPVTQVAGNFDASASMSGNTLGMPSASSSDTRMRTNGFGSRSISTFFGFLGLASRRPAAVKEQQRCKEVSPS